MKIGVFGGLGYFGSRLVSLLVDDNEVRVGDNHSYDVDNKWMDSMNKHENFFCYDLDVRNAGSTEKFIMECDKIVNFSALVGEPLCKQYPSETYQVNQQASCIISNQCKQYNKPMIFLSTCSNYGISEEYCNENSTLNPLTIYSRTKVEAEKYILATNSNAVVVRSSTVFGVSKARTRMDIIPNQFLKEAIEHKSVSIFQPKAVRPIVHVGDSARIIKTLLESAKPNYQVYNIGYDELNHTKEEMANAVSEVVKSEVKEIESTDVRTYKVDFTRLHDEFELREPVTMKQGLVHLYNEIQARDLPLDCGNF